MNSPQQLEASRALWRKGRGCVIFHVTKIISCRYLMEGPSRGNIMSVRLTFQASQPMTTGREANGN
jgi:hypothetical protein